MESNALSLPNPFVMVDGTPVRSHEQWVQQRRPELLGLFARYMYGVAPAAPGITATVSKTDPSLFDGLATLTEVTISINGLPAHAPRIHLALFTPNQASAPAPVFLGLNAVGNYAVVDHPSVTFNPQAWANPEWAGAARGGQTHEWCVENTLRRGYAFATYHTSDMDADRPDFSDGIHPFYSPEALGCTAAESWGTLRAWAWGLERCVDYLITHSALDPKRICLIGHSRLGKTVLLAGAIDERVALVVPHQSGTGGCALSRDNDQETVQKINDRFPHWFNGAFKKFNGREAALPVDQHLLLALVAPRAVLDTEGERDVWANPPAALRALHAADPVWKFLGASGLHDDGLLSEPQTLAGNAVGKLLQYRCDTGHEMNLGYWNISLDFADAVLG